MLFSVAISEYLTYLAIERDCTARTLETIRYHGKAWMAYFGNVDIDAISTHSIRIYFLNRKEQTNPRTGKPVADRTRIQEQAWLTRFFSWHARQGNLLKDPTLPIGRPKQRLPKLPRGFSLEEVRLIAETPVTRYTLHNKGGRLELRDRVAFSVMAFCGLRRSEVVALSVDDVDLDGKTLHVRSGKGEKEAILPLPDVLCDLLYRYLLILLPFGTERALFRHYRLKPTRWTDEGLRRAFARHLHTCGITRRISCHGLRHALATELLRVGVPIERVKELLRHENIQTTMIYTHLIVDDLREAQANHPLLRSKGEAPALRLLTS